VGAASSKRRMLGATADRENGFQGANTVLVSSTVSPAAIPLEAFSTQSIVRLLTSRRAVAANCMGLGAESPCTSMQALLPKISRYVAEIRGFGRFARVWPDLVVIAFRHGHFLLSVQWRIERGLRRNAD
jgi:hypothetical protein